MTDEELIARLRWKAGAYAKEAADRIEQLVSTNEALVKERDQWVEHTKNAVWADSEELKLANARAERLEAALREARQRVNDLVAERQADLHGARNDFNRGAVDALQEACSVILALIPKGGA